MSVEEMLELYLVAAREELTDIDDPSVIAKERFHRAVEIFALLSPTPLPDQEPPSNHLFEELVMEFESAKRLQLEVKTATPGVDE
jgi:hypothetical protein